VARHSFFWTRRELHREAAGSVCAATRSPKIHNGLVLAFHQRAQRRGFTVFVPSIPTPPAGAVYILS
jgi:hypothetical protein